MAYYSRIAQDAPVYVIYAHGGSSAVLTNDPTLFISDGHYEVDRVQMVHSTAGAAGTTGTLKRATTGAIGAGTSVAAAYPFDGAVNTVVTVALSSTLGNRLLAPGDRLGLDASADPTALAGFAVTIRLKRVRPIQS